MDSRYGILLGKRSGDSFRGKSFRGSENFCLENCEYGVLQADENAARNVFDAKVFASQKLLHRKQDFTIRRLIVGHLIKRSNPSCWNGLSDSGC